MSEPSNNFSRLIKDENARTCSSRELGAAEPAALLRDEPGVPADRDARGAGASVRGTPGGGGHPGVPLWDQADPVHPRPRAEDLLLRDALWDGHRCGRMLPVQGLSRCVCVCVCVCVCTLVVNLSVSNNNQNRKRNREQLIKGKVTR